MKKRTVALIMTLAIALAMFTGCSNGDSNSTPSGSPSGTDDSTPSPTASASESPSSVSAKFKILDGALATEDYGIGFRKADEQLRDTVDAALKVLKANGKAEEISNEWFGEDITTMMADENALDDIEYDSRKLILGLDDSFPPMGYRDENRNIVGFDIDLATAVCELLGWTLEIQPIDWSAKEMELESKNIDCIWNGMTLTDERLESMSCSAPYMSNGQVLVVMDSSGYVTEEDLADKRLALQAGSSAQDALDANSDFKGTLAEINTFSNNLECFMDLEQGGVDAVLIDSIVANWYIATGNTD